MSTNNSQISNLLNFVLKERNFYIIYFLIIFVPFLYFHPIKESMSCNTKNICTITHEYIGGIKFKDSMFLGNNPLILSKSSYNFTNLLSKRHYSHYDDYNIYITFNGKSPFRYYIKQSRSSKVDLSNELNNYKQGNYKINSKANSFNFYVFLIGFIIFYALSCFKVYEFLYLHVNDKICKLHE